ncbi:MAG: hypothetical protein LAP61_24465 [Acidobacteriia bacterium]|nr:hypothetical protein [Terriglobia bacterium]
MLELAPNDAIIKTYLQDIQRIKHGQQIAHEMGLRGPFQHLLDKAAKQRSWTLVPELSTYSGGKRVVPMEPCATSSGWREAVHCFTGVDRVLADLANQ